MKKTLLIIGLLIVLALAGGIYYLLTNLDALVKAAIEKYGSEATQTAVRVDSVHIELADGSAQINGLSIANPAGYDTKYAFTLGRIKTGIDLNSIRSQPYVITEVTVDALQVYAELNKERRISLNELRKNLTGGDTPQGKSAPAQQGGTELPRLIIRRIVFSNGTLNAKIVPLDNKQYTAKLPNIVMTDLGGKKGATPQELTREISKRLIDAGTEELKKTGAYAEIERLKAEVKQKLDAEKARLEEKVESKKAEEKQKFEDKKATEQKKLDEKLKGLLK